MNRPPPTPPSRRPPPPPTGDDLPGQRPTRLHAQGVQAAVGTPADQVEDSRGALPFADLSTATLAHYIDESLSEHAPEPSAVTIADPQLLMDEDYKPPGLLWKLTPFFRRVTPVVLSSVVTLGACWWMWGRHVSNGPGLFVTTNHAVAAEPPRPVPVTPPAPAPLAAAAKPAEPTVAAPAPASRAPVAAAAPAEPAPAERPAPAASSPAPDLEVAAARPAPAGARCGARIVSRPPGAAVMLGERRLGQTPLELRDLDCAERNVILVRPRYSPATTTLPVMAGSLEPVLVKLERPPAKLILSSSPPGARFTVNRTAVGASGTTEVKRFEQVKVEATLAGHRRWQQVLYVTDPATTIRASLTVAR